jgi:hypothetical protein
MTGVRLQALPRRRSYYFDRKFGQMKINQTKNDANSKKISAGSRTERMAIDEYGQENGTTAMMPANFISANHPYERGNLLAHGLGPRSVKKFAGAFFLPQIVILSFEAFVFRLRLEPASNIS